MSLLEKSFKLEEEICQAERVSKCAFILICLEIDEGKEAMNVTATLLVIIISSIYAHNWCPSYMLSFEGETVAIEGKTLIEGASIRCRQFQHIVVMRECKYAHFHLICCGAFILLHYNQIYWRPPCYTTLHTSAYLNRKGIYSGIKHRLLKSSEMRKLTSRMKIS